MSNAPKTGFWSSIPGLITATAGFLSAATGAIVALNQTGVVDLKKMSGNKPPEQVVSAPAATTVPPVEPAAEPKPVAEKAAPDATKTTEVPPVKTDPVAPPKPIEADPKANSDIRPIDPTPSQKTEVIPVPTATPVGEKQEPVATKPPEPLVDAAKKHEPSNVSKPIEPPPTMTQPAPAPVTTTRVVEHSPARPVQDPPTRPMPNPASTSPPTNTTDPRTRSSGSVPPPPSREPASPPSRAPTHERIADARTQERVPPPRPNEDIGGQPRVVRAPGSTVPDGGRSQSPDRPSPGRDGAPGGARAVQPGPAGRGRELDLTGLKLTIPSGWMPVENPAGTVAGEATLRIADPAGDGLVQVSRYMGAKGKDMEDKTIDRWLSQVSGGRGGPLDRKDAKIERRQHGPMKVTSVEFPGTLKVSPRDAGSGPQRMTGFIVDHPLGPHIITITGPAEAFARWSAAIDGFIASARPD